MFQQEKEYLEDAYSYYQKTGERSMQYEFSKDNREKQLTISENYDFASKSSATAY